MIAVVITIATITMHKKHAYLRTYIHAHLPMYVLSIYIHPDMYEDAYASQNLLSIHPSIHPSVRPSVRPSVHASMNPEP